MMERLHQAYCMLLLLLLLDVMQSTFRQWRMAPQRRPHVVVFVLETT
jgi:hypothetical protein